jgi:hypothetical protein
MKAQAGKSPFLPMLVTGIAVVLFSTGGVARMMGWSPHSTGDSSGIPGPGRPVPVELASEAPVKPRCPECGMIMSVREIGMDDEESGHGAAGEAIAGNRNKERVKSARSYQITVLMAGGSSRVINHANPANWRPGERMILIDGANPPNR